MEICLNNGISFSNLFQALFLYYARLFIIILIYELIYRIYIQGSLLLVDADLFQHSCYMKFYRSYFFPSFSYDELKMLLQNIYGMVSRSVKMTILYCSNRTESFVDFVQSVLRVLCSCVLGVLCSCVRRVLCSCVLRVLCSCVFLV